VSNADSGIFAVAERSFTVEPNEWGGWRLRLIECEAGVEVEMGGGAFPADDYDAALEEGENWISEDRYCFHCVTSR
jgi:hypothetical protein